jgi:hypothetical protein
VSDGDALSTWTSSDAWILAATPNTKRGSTLSRVIGSADALNHDIPSRDALARGLGALIAAGLVEEVHGLYRTTPEGRAMRKHWTGGMFNWGSLLPHLQELDRPNVEISLTETEYDDAYGEYRERVRPEVEGVPLWRRLWRRIHRG